MKTILPTLLCLVALFTARAQTTNTIYATPFNWPVNHQMVTPCGTFTYLAQAIYKNPNNVATCWFPDTNNLMWASQTNPTSLIMAQTIYGHSYCAIGSDLTYSNSPADTNEGSRFVVLFKTVQNTNVAYPIQISGFDTNR